MIQPNSPLELQQQLASEALLLKEGDLATLGGMIGLLEQVPAAGQEAHLEDFRRMMERMTTLAGSDFDAAHQQLIQALQSPPPAENPSPEPGSLLSPGNGHPEQKEPIEPTAGDDPETSAASAGAEAAQPPEGESDSDRPEGEPNGVPLGTAPVAAEPFAGALAGESPVGELESEEQLLDQELFQEFIEESVAYLEAVELHILSLETEPENAEIVNDIFRVFHTIKGVSGFLALKGISRICHALENLLDEARKGKIQITGPISDLVLETVDLLKTIIRSFRGVDDPQVPLREAQPKIEALLGKIEHTQNQTAETSGSPGEETASTVAQPPETKTEGAPAVETHPPVPDSAAPEPSPSVQEAAGPPEPAAASAQSSPEGPPGQEGTGGGAAGASGGGGNGGGASSTESIRVRISMLDQLVNLAGELVLGRNQLLQKLSGTAAEMPGLNSILQQVDRVTSELQETVMKTRMQPLGGLFSRFHRVIRDLGRSLGKQIQLSLSGETVELDKSLIEALSDPLTHIIRNCADHGIESPEQRIAAGKPAAGHITLNAYHEGGKVHVVISDDGAGVDIARVKEKAVEKGMLAPDRVDQISDKEALHFLFAPGFSTADKVTGVSGRGVGMDVVRSNIERIGGVVDIATEPGKGTTILLDLPLTLAIVPALLVRAGGQRFAIPQINLLELVHLEGGEAKNAIMHVGDSEVYQLRGQMLTLLRLGGVLRIDEGPGATTEKEEPTSVFIVVLASGKTQFGLLVDQVFDTEEIVVKPLSNLLKNVGVFAGSTLMGDGHVALILDVPGLAKTAHLTLEEDRSATAFSAEQKTAVQEEQTILLFNISLDEQFAVPLSLVSRLEEVPANKIEPMVNQKVIPYRGKLLPLVFLEDHLSIAPPPENRETVSVLVFEIEQLVGVVVTRVIDAVQLQGHLEPIAAHTPGVTGMAPIQEKPTAFLDIYQLIELAYPEWFRMEKETRKRVLQKEEVNILLAEDSSFYRNVVGNYLRQEGYRVVEAEDGNQALKILEDQTVDLIVTDIEMPGMDGFELTRRIRADKSLQHLPIVAVTSLANDEHRRAGSKAGVDVYLIKLKREQLLKEITRLLAPASTEAKKLAS